MHVTTGSSTELILPTLSGNGYPDEPSTFGNRLSGTNAYVKILTGNDGRRIVEVKTTKSECRFLFTFDPQKVRDLPKELRFQVGQRFEEKGYEYTGLRKTGPYGFVKRWEAYQKGDTVLLVKGTANRGDGDIIFRFANLKDVSQ